MKKNNFYSGGFAPIWILLVTALSGLATFGGKIAADTFNKLAGTNQQTEQQLRNSLLYLNKEKLLGSKIEGSLTGTVILTDGSYSGYKINKADIGVTPKTNNDTFYKGNAEIEFLSKDIGTGNYSDNKINPFYLKDGTTTNGTIVDKMSASLLTKEGQNIPIRILEGKVRNGVLNGNFQAQTYSSGYILAGTLDDFGNVSAITILSGGKKLAEGPTLIAPKVLDLFKQFKTEDQSKVLAATDTNTNLSFQEGMPIIENPSKGTFFPPTAGNVVINNVSQGPVGPQGPQGPAGANGIDGINGNNGVNGTNGMNGADGAIGPQGPAGSGSTTWGSITGTLSTQSDLNSALAGKEPIISSGTTSQYFRGDKTFQTLDKNAVGLGNVENTALSTWPGSTNITTLGTIGSLNATNVSIGGTTTLTNLAVGTGTTGIFIDSSGVLSKRLFGTLAFDSSTYDNYNHWTLQSNGTGTTSILSGNTVNFVNGVGISLVQNGSTITVNNVGSGTTYGAGSGLSLSSNIFSLNLGSTNTWTAPQSFGNLTIGGAFVSVGSTNLVSNLNANYLNGISSAGFVGIGQTGNFVNIGQTGSLPYVNDATNGTLTRSGTGPYTLALNLGSTNTWTALETFNNVNIGGTVNLTGINIGTGTTGLFVDSTGLVTKRLFGTLAFDSSTYDNYNHWTLQNNGTGTTNVLSGNTVNFVNGVGISLSQSGSTITINNTGTGTTYAAGNGLSLASNIFSLNLGSTNTWTAPQSFSNLTIGGTFVSVGSTNLVTNLNANYLNGIASSGFVGVGQTGSLPYINDATNGTLTRSGTGPYTLALNLGSSNTWTGLETFNNVNIGGTLNLTGINVGTGTTGLFIDTAGLITKRLFGTLAFDSSTYDNYNHWTLQANGTGTTSILSGNTVNFVNGVGISLSQSGSTITVSNVGSGTTYGADGGLILASNVFSLNLGSTNTWLAPQSFGNLTIGGTFVSVGSTNLVTNLNANYLNGIASSGFVGVGQTGSLPYVNNTTDGTLTRSGTGPYTLALNLGSSNTWTGLETFNNLNIGGTLNLTGINVGTGTTGLFIDSTGLITKRLFGTLAFDSSTYDNYNHWTLQTNGSGSTSVLSSNTVNFVNGVGVSMVQNGSTVTINDVGIGTTYAAGSGLNLISNTFSLNLGSTNTWLAPQSFGNLTIGGTFVSVGSTNLVTNLNANYLNGIASSGFVGVGQTGTLPYVNDATNGTLTRSGTGPYTLALNLGSTNTWTALQTFTNGIGVSGSTNITTTSGILSLSGLLTSSITTAAGNNFTLSTGTTGNLTLDSGTVGSIFIGTGANAKTINIGNTVGATALNLFTGTGGINIGTDAIAKTISIGTGAANNTINIGTTFDGSTVNILSGTGNVTFNVGGNSVSGKVIIGNSGTTAPDLLVLDNGTTDPTGTNGSMYYNSSLNKFRCFENSAWKNCDTSIPKSSNIGSTGTFTLGNGSANEAVIISGTGPSITPTNTTSRILITGSARLGMTANDSETSTVRIRRGVGCTGPQVDGDLTLLTVGNNASDAPATHYISWSLIDSPNTTSSQTYTACGFTSTATTPNTISFVDMTLIEVAASGADLAELYSTTDRNIGPGDLVALDNQNEKYVKKTLNKYDKNLLGVVSTTPGLTLSDGTESSNAVMIALAGRVPVKVTTENGVISAGDFLTSSSIPGVAMKATKAGNIIGQAITSYTGQEIGEAIVFVKNGVSNGAKLSEILPNQTSNQIDYNNLFNNISGQNTADLSDITTDRLMAGVEIISPKITTQEIFTNSIKPLNKDGKIILNRTIFDKDMAGTAVIKKDSDRVQIDFEKEYEQKPAINISMETNDINTLTQIFGENYQYLIANKNTKGFTIVINKNAKEDITFSWVAIAAKDAKTFYSQITPAPTPTPTHVEQITPTDIPTSTIFPTPAATPIPTLEPTVIPTISPEPTPNEIATDSAQIQ
jgi:trimeric autotransporter adhesin